MKKRSFRFFPVPDQIYSLNLFLKRPLKILLESAIWNPKIRNPRIYPFHFWADFCKNPNPVQNQKLDGLPTLLGSPAGLGHRTNGPRLKQELQQILYLPMKFLYVR